MANHSIGYKISGTPICVDYWNVCDGNQASNRFHFLTHAHDHSMVALTPSWRHRIYCSPITAKITAILQELQPSSFVTIGIGQTISIDCSRIEAYEGKSFTVTALDAYHCPGSTMFLFEGWFGRVLATGAFRFDLDFDLQRLREISIDHLYLDVTNWTMGDDASLDIPARICSLMKTLRIIARRPKNETILLVTPDSSAGQEDLLTGISTNFEELIAVPGYRLKLLEAAELNTCHFTDDPRQTRFQLVNGTKGQIIRAIKDELQSSRSITVIIFLTPSMESRWNDLRQPADDGGQLCELQKLIHFVPYSDHSTTSELQAFLKELKVGHLHFTGRHLSEAEIDQLQRDLKSNDKKTTSGKDEIVLLDSQPDDVIVEDPVMDGKENAMAMEPDEDMVLDRSGFIIRETDNMIFTDQDWAKLLKAADIRLW